MYYRLVLSQQHCASLVPRPSRIFQHTWEKSGMPGQYGDLMMTADGGRYMYVIITSPNRQSRNCGGYAIITSPNRPGLPDFSRLCWKMWEGLGTRLPCTSIVQCCCCTLLYMHIAQNNFLLQISMLLKLLSHNIIIGYYSNLHLTQWKPQCSHFSCSTLLRVQYRLTSPIPRFWCLWYPHFLIMVLNWALTTSVINMYMCAWS